MLSYEIDYYQDKLAPFCFINTLYFGIKFIGGIAKSDTNTMFLGKHAE